MLSALYDVLLSGVEGPDEQFVIGNQTTLNHHLNAKLNSLKSVNMTLKQLTE
jgi:hypothetical protein